MDKNIEYWNYKSERFTVDVDLDENITILGIKNLLQLPAPIRVLDIGCGNGRFSYYLSDKVDQIVGIDLSPKMIEKARQLTADKENTIFIQGDFITKREEVRALGPYDLVLASMTPAISDLKAFKEMISLAPCGVLAQHSYRKNPMIDRIREHFGLKPPDLRGFFYQMFQTLWDMGLYPHVLHKKNFWDRVFTVEEMERDLLMYLGKLISLSSEDRDWVRQYIEQYVEREIVHSKTDLVESAICWQRNGL